MENNMVAVLLSAVAVVLTAILSIVWVWRVRAARRFTAAVDAHAEREIARQRRRNGPRTLLLPYSSPDSSRF
jgi:hypothetical protein